MTEPNNGAILGSGERPEKTLPPQKEIPDQFEQENEPEQPVKDTGKQAGRGQNEAKGTKSGEYVSSIMQDLLGSNLGEIRVSKISVELSGEQRSLKIAFGNKQTGRLLTLRMDGTWSYEA